MLTSLLLSLLLVYVRINYTTVPTDIARCHRERSPWGPMEILLWRPINCINAPDLTLHACCGLAISGENSPIMMGLKTCGIVPEYTSVRGTSPQPLFFTPFLMGYAQKAHTWGPCVPAVSCKDLLLHNQSRVTIFFSDVIRGPVVSSGFLMPPP